MKFVWRVLELFSDPSPMEPLEFRRVCAVFLGTLQRCRDYEQPGQNRVQNVEIRVCCLNSKWGRRFSVTSVNLVSLNGRALERVLGIL